MRDAHHPHPRIAVRVTVGGELFEVRAVGGGRSLGGVGAQARLLRELPGRSRGQILVLPDEAAGQRPLPLERGLAPAHHEGAQGVLAHGEDDQIDSDSERRERRRVVGGHEGDHSRLPDDKQPVGRGRTERASGGFPVISA